jgi:hypothetical protein
VAAGDINCWLPASEGRPLISLHPTPAYHVTQSQCTGVVVFSFLIRNRSFQADHQSEAKSPIHNVQQMFRLKSCLLPINAVQIYFNNYLLKLATSSWTHNLESHANPLINLQSSNTYWYSKNCRKTSTHKNSLVTAKSHLSTLLSSFYIFFCLWCSDCDAYTCDTENSLVRREFHLYNGKLHIGGLYWRERSSARSCQRQEASCKHSSSDVQMGLLIFESGNR